MNRKLRWNKRESQRILSQIWQSTCKPLQSEIR